MTLWGCAFEDFLTPVCERDSQTFVSAYFKRRGRKKCTSQAYMKALSTRVMSLYEASEIVPEKTVTRRRYAAAAAHLFTYAFLEGGSGAASFCSQRRRSSP